MFGFNKNNVELPRVFKITLPVSSTCKALLILEDYNFLRVTHPSNSTVMRAVTHKHAAEIQVLVSEEKLAKAVDGLEHCFMGEQFSPSIIKMSLRNNNVSQILESEECLV